MGNKNVLRLNSVPLAAFLVVQIAFISMVSANSTPVELNICSFNVQFLGSFKSRDDKALAQIVWDGGCDVVVIQELVAPPDLRIVPISDHFGQAEPAKYPDGTPHNPSEASTEFFLAMAEVGYDGMWLSEQDTGPRSKNKNNGASTEWYVSFYKKSKVKPATDLPNGFISSGGRVTNHRYYERVPFATAFRTLDDGYDFVLISVHLRPGSGPWNRNRRQVELRAISRWIDHRVEKLGEKNFVVLGDMNINEEKHLWETIPEGYYTLNYEARATNTNPNSVKPYDHVVFDLKLNPEIPLFDNFEILDLVKLARPFWESKEAYPGEPYNHNAFRTRYSDHQPVKFKVFPTEQDLD